MDNIAFSTDTATTSISKSPEKGNEDCRTFADGHTRETSINICLTPEKSKEVLGAEDIGDLTIKKDVSRLNVNEKLKKTLEEHGIPRQNADSFLLGLLKNREFKKLIMTTDLNEVDSSDEGSSIPAVPMTRAKLKEVMKNSPFKTLSDGPTKMVITKFTEIPLSDDDDEEYNPIDSSFSSDTQDGSLVDDDIENKIDKNCDKKTEQPVSNVVCGIESKLTEIEEPAQGGNDDIISKRTRSKHSLQSTSLDVLEAAFDPPDTTSDMYNTTVVGDYDWHKWLSEIAKDGGGENNATDEEDDPEEDPDFNFIPELDKPDEEDMRDDHSVQVSKKELYGLLDEMENMQKNDWPPMTRIADDSFQPFSSPKQVKNKPPKRGQERAEQPEIPHVEMSHSQIELLKQQLQQHVQLLAQVNLLCRNNADFNECVEESRELLLELQQVGLTQMNLLCIESSLVTPWSLKEAIALTEINVPPSEPSVRLLGREVNRGQESLPKSVAKIIANSKVFMYREMLPLSAPSLKNSSQKVPFRPAEDCLVALGLAEMKGIGMQSIFELISQHMLPTKTDKQIQVRIRNVLSCRNIKDTVNPIRNYHVRRTLPAPITTAKFVYEQSAEKPIDMKDTLPSWVLALKPVYIPDESSDDSLSDLVPSHAQPIPARRCLIEDQQILTSPCKAVMVPCSIIEAVPVSAINIPVHQFIQNINVTLPKVSSRPCQSYSSVTEKFAVGDNASRVPSLSTVVTPTPIYAKPVTTAKIQTSLKHGRRQRSAGKSIKRLSECERSAIMTLSSSSSEEEHELEDLSSPAKDDIIHFEVEETPPAESDDDDQSDPEGRSESKSTEVISSLSMSTCARREDPKFIPKGGYLQKMHPKLSGRKGKPSSRDLLRARSTAKVVKCLEDDTIVQSDPRRIEKENLFATGYLERVEKALQNDPGIYKKFLETLIKHSTKSPVDLYTELSTLLHDWPELVQGFAPFLKPEQAQECGSNMVQEVHARARKFLRQLEIQFSSNPDHMEKILNVFNNVTETAIHEEELMKSVLTLLKDYPYLQDEFLTFFDSQHPPKVLFDEDFEEVDFTEELMKDPTLNQFEQVTLSLEPAESDHIPPNENTIKRVRKRKISLGSREESKSPAKVISLIENKENISPEIVISDVDDEDEEETANSDYESEDVMEDIVEDQEMTKSSTSVRPDIDMVEDQEMTKSSTSVRPDIDMVEDQEMTKSSTSVRPDIDMVEDQAMTSRSVHPDIDMVEDQTMTSTTVRPDIDMVEDQEMSKPSTSVPPDIAIITRIAEERTLKPSDLMQPDTPTGITLSASPVVPGNIVLPKRSGHLIGADPTEGPKDSGISVTDKGRTPVRDEKALDITHADDKPAIQNNNTSSLTKEGTSTQSLMQEAVTPHTVENTRPVIEGVPARGVAEEKVATSAAAGRMACSPVAEKKVVMPAAEGVQPGKDDALHAIEERRLRQTGNAACAKQADAAILPSGLHQTKNVTWTRQADELILTSCQKGLTQRSVFAEVAEKLGRTLVQVESRLAELLYLFDGSETDDAITQESEEDIFSDCSGS